MPRVKISEFDAKRVLISSYLGLPATNHTTVKDIEQVFNDTNLVIKVDQGIKKRGKQGLVKVNVTKSEVPAIIKEWTQLGWSNFLIEPVIEHAPSAEQYLSLERVRTGWAISYSDHGGIEVESAWESVKTVVTSGKDNLSSLNSVAIQRFLEHLLPLLDQYHISFLEMNPILIRSNQIIPLDMACEVDNALSPLPPIPDRALSDSEKSILTLDSATPASLKFKLINPGGSIWVFLSGGGASLVIADEVADQGLGAKLANYGEYSGAPTNDDVYAYAKIILAQLLASKSKSPKAIIIAGGVANFTDVAKTFRGLIRALSDEKIALVKAKVKVFVRRGGPNEVQGLAMMKEFLTQSNLLGSVHGHETALTQVVNEVKEYLA